ncbi:hypothetical protein SLEP1_g54124 [Rubroshorea leprosula]|uniref:Uncharacterized protein n=1 Tax=Rubroshorea leprosula TaxID=152421 RepID=A0AAV5MBL6_9ROSI|nr:hypothetical protein SLEP1_g54124 [Rubroshorea leprosula]
MSILLFYSLFSIHGDFGPLIELASFTRMTLFSFFF